MRFIKSVWHRLRDRFRRIGLLHALRSMYKISHHGEKVYRSLLTKYGEGTQIYVEHYPGTGDIYITCALLQKYHQQLYGDKPYVVTVIGGGAKKIAGLLGIEQVEILSQEDSDEMISYYRFMGDLPDFTILHFAPIAMYTRILDAMAGYNDLDFMSLYLNTVFRGMKWEDAVDFNRENDDSSVDEYLDEYCLEREKTVVLFPYANTVDNLPMELWEEFARHLREIGFSVCTNVEPGGPVVPGTYGVFVPYKDIKPFVERAGYMVSLRSGMCDILADTDCRKYILYPTPNYYKFGVGSFFDYFSLQKMKIGKKLNEYEFERIYTQNMFKCVFWDICKTVGISRKDFRLVYSTRDFSQHILRVCSDDNNVTVID